MSVPSMAGTGFEGASPRRPAAHTAEGTEGADVAEVA